MTLGHCAVAFVNFIFHLEYLKKNFIFIDLMRILIYFVFPDSDIEFVPCHENTYKDSLVFDIQNDMEKIICRKSRRECPAVEQGLLGSNVRRVIG